MDDCEQPPLRILFFPFLVPGHLIPMANMATLLAARGVRCTILTTPFQATIIHSVLDRNGDASPGPGSIDVAVVPFPDVGLPPAAESGVGHTAEENLKFHRAAELLREPFQQFLADHPLDAVVSDSMFPWSVDATAEHGIPRLAFLGTSMFSRACTDTMLRNNPFQCQCDGAVVSLPGLPHRVRQRRSQMMDPAKRPHMWARFQVVNAADQRSYGELFNSFHELEPDYVEHYHTTLGRRVWLVGPLSLARKDDAAARADGCLRWLDAMPTGSVVYVSFGTLTKFSPEQVRELARGLQLSGKRFVWVMANSGASAAAEEEEILTATSRSQGFIVRGWAPQELILNHPAVGCFLTHCGWNSTLEAVTAGVPMVTWPRFHDQFQNEKLIVEVLEVGIGLGADVYASCAETHPVIGGEAIAESIMKLMDGDVMRNRVKELAGKAKNAVQKGGSSYMDVGRLLDDLMARRSLAAADS